MRARVTAATNKAEAYNGFSAWLRFGNNGVIADNDPAEQEKSIKFNSLLADLVVFHTAVDMMTGDPGAHRRGLADQPRRTWPSSRRTWSGTSAGSAPYATDELHIPPDAFDPALAEVDFDAEPAAA